MRAFLAFLAPLLLFTCQSLPESSGFVTGSPPLCREGVALGAIGLQVVDDWPEGQKEPERRRQMAEAVVREVLAQLPCGHPVEAGQIPQNLMTVTLYAFGPELRLSLPVLWRSNTHVAFSITLRNRESGAVIYSNRTERRQGGAFAIRMLAHVPATMREALMEMLIGAPSRGRTVRLPLHPLARVAPLPGPKSLF